MTMPILIQLFQFYSVNDSPYFDFSIFTAENLPSLNEVEPKHAFTFNDTHFRIGHNVDSITFSKSVSFTLVFNEKSVCKLII
jgi:hypothetical protein